MDEPDTTYRALADRVRVSPRATSTTSCTATARCRRTRSCRQLADALGVEPEHFREYRLRVITDRLEAMPEMIDRLYKRFG